MPVLLDLFCGAGGCSVGYQRAGFVPFGVDLNTARLKHYPYEHAVGDALAWLEQAGPEWDVIHASPPCQAYSITRHSHNREHPDLLEPVRQGLRDWVARTGGIYVIENVPGAPMHDPVTLCGSMFGLETHDDKDGRPLHLKRHRLFESNIPLMTPSECRCLEYRRQGIKVGGVYGGGSQNREHPERVRRGGYSPNTATAQRLMGIDWMPRRHLAQAIPPAYTEWIGRQIINILKGEGAA